MASPHKNNPSKSDSPSLPSSLNRKNSKNKGGDRHNQTNRSPQGSVEARPASLIRDVAPAPPARKSSVPEGSSVKNTSPIVGDDLPAKRHLASGSEGSSKSKAPVIESRKSHSNSTTLAQMQKKLTTKKSAQKSESTHPPPAETKKKILIKLRSKGDKPATAEEAVPQQDSPKTIDTKEEADQPSDAAAAATEDLGDDDDDDVKIWNLRPRKTKSKKGNTAKNKGDPAKSDNAEHPVPSPPDHKTKNKRKLAESSSSPSKNNEANNNQPPQKKKSAEKRKMVVAVTLTKREIEEDLYSMTGMRPSRRPKRRPKNVQKQIELIFPGNGLNSLSADSYKA